MKFAMEGRKRVKDQLFRIDTTYADVNFAYTDKAGKENPIATLEELEYPNYFHKTVSSDDATLPELQSENSPTGASALEVKNVEEKQEPKEGHLTFAENQRGVSYDNLFSLYFKGAKHITITDPYIRLFYQARNLMELLETIIKEKAQEDKVVVSLVTVEDALKCDQKREFFEKIQNEMFTVGIKFTYTFDNTGSQHARHIVTDTGWKISLDRGLDIYQQYEMGDAFQLANRNQKHRSCKAFEVTYIRL